MQPTKFNNAVDIEGIANLCGVTRQTVTTWRYKGLLPKPKAYAGKSPLWEVEDLADLLAMWL